MSLKVIKAVYHSHLERAYRPLAALLAFYADDEGHRVFPGADTLADALGLREPTVRHNLAALLERGVILRTGTVGHVREFRFDLDRLKTYRPERTKTARKAPKNRHSTLPSAATAPRTYNPAAGGQQPCRLRPTTLPSAANNPAVGGHHQIFSDRHEHHEYTGAVAPGFTQPEPKTEDQEVLSPYEELADVALGCACRERNDSHSNVVTHFERLCAKHDVPYDEATAHHAVDVAISRTALARAALFNQGGGIGPRPLTPRPLRRKVL